MTQSTHTPPLPSVSPEILALPFATRLALWMAYGTALGIPVDGALQIVNTMVAAARRQLHGKRLGLSIGERLSLATLATTIPVAVWELFQWLIKPESLVRWLKRYQQRKANGDITPTPKPGRPSLGEEKVGSSRIFGERLESMRWFFRTNIFVT
jgi:hypothetical protein